MYPLEQMTSLWCFLKEDMPPNLPPSNYIIPNIFYSRWYVNFISILHKDYKYNVSIYELCLHFKFHIDESEIGFSHSSTLIYSLHWMHGNFSRCLGTIYIFFTWHYCRVILSFTMYLLTGRHDFELSLIILVDKLIKTVG